jgi:hypothetical protein
VEQRKPNRRSPTQPRYFAPSPRRSHRIFGWICFIMLLVVIHAFESGQESTTSSSSTAPTSCVPADFTVSKLRGRWEDEYIRLTGVITSHCQFAGGPKIKWTVYNQDGSIAFSGDFWPASTVNLAPGEAYPLKRYTQGRTVRGSMTCESLMSINGEARPALYPIVLATSQLHTLAHSERALGPSYGGTDRHQSACYLGDDKR